MRPGRPSPGRSAWQDRGSTCACGSSTLAPAWTPCGPPGRGLAGPGGHGSMVGSARPRGLPGLVWPPALPGGGGSRRGRRSPWRHRSGVGRRAWILPPRLTRKDGLAAPVWRLPSPRPRSTYVRPRVWPLVRRLTPSLHRRSVPGSSSAGPNISPCQLPAGVPPALRAGQLRLLGLEGPAWAARPALFRALSLGLSSLPRAFLDPPLGPPHPCLTVWGGRCSAPAELGRGPPCPGLLGPNLSSKAAEPSSNRISPGC